MAKCEPLSAENCDMAEGPLCQPYSTAPIGPGTTQFTLLQVYEWCLFPVLNSNTWVLAFDIHAGSYIEIPWLSYACLIRRQATSMEEDDGMH